MNFATLIAKTTNIALPSCSATIDLLESGATVPFIARYRKEATNNLDELQITAIKDNLAKFKELDDRKQTILKTINEQGKLTPQLEAQISQSWDAKEIEDLYLPYKPKRLTRATKAKQLGLEPLAIKLLTGQIHNLDKEVEQIANKLNLTPADALQGARDIIAEQVADNKEARDIVRSAFNHSATIATKKKANCTSEELIAKYADYINRTENLARCPSHRFLAMARAEREGVISLKITPDDPERPLSRLNRRFIRIPQSPVASQLQTAINDSYSRLIEPSIETEVNADAKQKADEQAIAVFATNLRQLLLAAPLGEKNILAIDPGIRTGCKTVCLDRQGTLLYHTVIFPERTPQDLVASLIKKYNIEAIAIGNGTASRETEAYIRSFVNLPIFVVSEDGASIYSASDVAREEFPNEDVTVRGAVSIGRRLMDPLAELVKLDPKSIGVGQYQHDVDQTRLKASLDDVVISCVNSVGINLNTAGKHILTYVSGLGPQLAQNIVDYRRENGPFKSRAQLKKVPRLGPKAFEQCAGFLRIRGAQNPLDNTAVHPESYHIVEQMATDQHCTVADLISSPEKRAAIRLEQYVAPTVGLPTLRDIMHELDKPGLDPRGTASQFAFSPDVHTINDLRPGMELPGIISNITAFGCFVNIGVKNDGLIHISQLANHYVKDINAVVKLNQQVIVKILDVDLSRARISLKLIK